MSSSELGYPVESFPTLKPAFVIKVVGIKEKFPVGNVWTGGQLIAVVCRIRHLHTPHDSFG
jgi:hypothetical protein